MKNTTENILENNNECCVYKASPSGIQVPLYYGSEEDCRKFCEEKDYEYIDAEEVVWYLEISSRKAVLGNAAVKAPISA